MSGKNWLNPTGRRGPCICGHRFKDHKKHVCQVSGCTCHMEENVVEAMHCLAVVRSLATGTRGAQRKRLAEDVKRRSEKIAAAGYYPGMADIVSARAALRADEMGWNPNTGAFDRQRTYPAFTSVGPSK